MVRIEHIHESNAPTRRRKMFVTQNHYKLGLTALLFTSPVFHVFSPSSFQKHKIHRQRGVLGALYINVFHVIADKNGDNFFTKKQKRYWLLHERGKFN